MGLSDVALLLLRVGLGTIAEPAGGLGVLVALDRLVFGI